MTAEGAQLLGYARRMLALNDEALARLMADAYEGEVRLGVPHDIVYPAIPQVLRQFAADFPRVRVVLHSSFTNDLLGQFARGDCDLILATEDGTGAWGRDAGRTGSRLGRGAGWHRVAAAAHPARLRDPLHLPPDRAGGAGSR
jgi:DNA-binding transcriptional LysR family regulator